MFFNSRQLPLVVATLLCWSASVSFAALQPTGLTCEYLTDPLGIDTVQPRLSWQLESTDPAQRGAHQQAYRLLVASSPERLADDQADLWDSGRVASNQSIHVAYNGRPLQSHQACWWKVRVWDQDSNVGAWSKPARWSMGILNADDWQAKWLRHTPETVRQLSADDPGRLLTFDGCSWIWAPDPQPIEALPAGNRFFRKTIELPADKPIEWAYLLIAADDRYWLHANGKRISIARDEPDAWRTGYEVEMDEKLQPGRNVLALQVNNKQPGPAGVAGKLVVQLQGGKTLIVPIDESWKASLRGGRNWQQPDFDDSNWPSARTLVAVGEKPWCMPQTGYAVGWYQTAPSPLLRKSFSVAQPVKQATAYVTGVGYYELHLNGKKVGDHVLDPAFTRFDRRVLYSTYDVTNQVQQGSNALGMMLGNGWYNMHTRATWDFDQAPWRDEPRMLLHLRLELADGSIQTVVSDESWKASTGPLALDSIRAGELYDARREIPGWDSADFSDRKWADVTITDPPQGVLSAQMMPPLRVTETIRPVSVKETRPGVYLFDLGQTVSGWARLHVRGKAGTAVTMRYSERAREDGSLDREENRQVRLRRTLSARHLRLEGARRRTVGTALRLPRFSVRGSQRIPRRPHFGQSGRTRRSYRLPIRR